MVRDYHSWLREPNVFRTRTHSLAFILAEAPCIVLLCVVLSLDSVFGSATWDRTELFYLLLDDSYCYIVSDYLWH